MRKIVWLLNLGHIGEKKYPTPDNHFFEISKDKFSRERVKRLREIRREIDSMYPELDIAFSLWGSLSKGKELKHHGDADTDLTIFYNEEALKKIANEDNVFFGVPKAHLVTHRSYEDVFTDMLGDYVRKRIGEGYWGSDATSGIVLYSVYDGFYDDISTSIMPARNIFVSTLFGYDLGGLRFYQRRVLQNISKLSREERDEWWEKFKVGCTRFFRRRDEEDLSNKLKAEIPQTFEDACKKYGVSI